ncbi:MAG: MCP four helix bundle domain-containing protein [Acidobacteriota bacterium]|nr:MCP four helix bundle domain-containing protein [Acidobacteriota bacterium]
MSSHSASTGNQTRRLLLIGFGGLLLLLAFTGFNALSVLNRIQRRNESIRQDYVNRDLILQQLRSDIYLSGTYVRDLLLEPDPTRADVHRNELNAARGRIESMIAAYRQVLRGEEKAPFQRFTKAVVSYFDSLRPALQWDSTQRRQFGYSFMKDSLLPKRMVIVQLADQISQLNQEQMETGSKRVAALFSTFRRDLIVLLIITLLIGLLLAGGSIHWILRLERLSTLRFDEALQARSALRDLSARLVEVQETERRALSRELHDEVGQALSALLLALGNVAAMISPDENPEARNQLLDTRRVAEKTVAVVRDMSLLLRPSMLDDLGLIPALEWQAREVSRTNNLRVTVQADSVPEDLPDEQRTCIYRVVQEALRNVTRHAKAKHIQIRLSQDDEALRLTIQDDGQGFIPARERGVGLLGMEERVKRLDGSFQVQSQPGNGTVIHVELPRLVLSG